MTTELSWAELTKLPFDGPVVCRCCGCAEEFETPEQAHNSRWDVAPYFTVAPLCPRCLSATYVRGTCRHGQPADKELT